MQKHPSHYPTDLTDREWNQIECLVPALKSGKGKRRRPLRLSRRRLLDATFYVVRSGCAWRLLPHDFGPWQTVYGHFRIWGGGLDSDYAAGLDGGKLALADMRMQERAIQFGLLVYCQKNYGLRPL